MGNVRRGPDIGTSSSHTVAINVEGIRDEIERRRRDRCAGPADVAPGQAYTTQEFADLQGWPLYKAKRFLAECVHAGEIVDVVQKRVQRIGGTWFTTTAYRFRDEWVKQNCGRGNKR